MFLIQETLVIGIYNLLAALLRLHHHPHLLLLLFNIKVLFVLINLLHAHGAWSGSINNNNNNNNVGAVIEKWLEEDKAVPLKKRRRGSFEKIKKGEDDGTTATKARMKCKTNKKCSIYGHEDYEMLGGIEEEQDDDEDYETKGGGGKKIKTKKKKKKKKKKVRGSVIMEGSRCSRVNGRGWRCCQPTLVGYSLCEHHLGKGRLRSMSSVRNRSATSSDVAVLAPKRDNDDEIGRDLQAPRSNLRLGITGEEMDGEGRKEKVKRKGKLGMVKARSISSLLSQVSARDDDHNNPAVNGC